jgi:5-methylcytosine-specific restriction endonuclease McrA
VKRTPIKRTRSTGPDAVTRAKVWERDQSRCALCGTTAGPFSIHHRLPRGRGGDNRLSNLVLLCDFGGCHDLIAESQRRRSTLNGWLVRTGFDPQDVPLIHSGEWIYLCDDGSIVPLGEAVS